MDEQYIDVIPFQCTLPNNFQLCNAFENGLCFSECGTCNTNNKFKLIRIEEYSSKNLEIGERITLKDGTILECKEVDDCKDCYFKGKKDCMKEVVGTCAYLSRRDNTSVYFQKVCGEQGGNRICTKKDDRLVGG